VIEAQLRGRAVLGARVGGIPDLVADGVDGVLFEPTPAGIASALAVVEDRAGLERLGAAARVAGERQLVTPDEYGERMRELVTQ